MTFSPKPGREQASTERLIGSLCARTGASDAEVRALFTSEFARLALGATVRSYLALRAGANVRALLRRTRRSLGRDVERRVDSTIHR